MAGGSQISLQSSTNQGLRVLSGAAVLLFLGDKILKLGDYFSGAIYIRNNRETPKKIELRNVSFRYETDGKDVIRNLSLTLEPGEHLAVVGLNGAGKTTLVKLICGLTEATDGEILYDGTDVREYNRDD